MESNNYQEGKLLHKLKETERCYYPQNVTALNNYVHWNFSTFLSTFNSVTMKMSVAPDFNCFSFDALTQLNPKESSNKTRSLGNSLPLKEDDVYVKDCFKIPPLLLLLRDTSFHFAGYKVPMG